MANYAQKTLGAFIVNNDDAFLRSVSVMSKAKKPCSKKCIFGYAQKSYPKASLVNWPPVPG